jgi:hypothetical protein
MAMLSRASGLVHGNEKAPPEEAGRVMLAHDRPYEIEGGTGRRRQWIARSEFWVCRAGWRDDVDLLGHHESRNRGGQVEEPRPCSQGC